MSDNRLWEMLSKVVRGWDRSYCLGKAGKSWKRLIEPVG